MPSKRTPVALEKSKEKARKQRKRLMDDLATALRHHIPDIYQRIRTNKTGDNYYLKLYGTHHRPGDFDYSTISLLEYVNLHAKISKNTRDENMVLMMPKGKLMAEPIIAMSIEKYLDLLHQVDLCVLGDDALFEGRKPEKGGAM